MQLGVSDVIYSQIINYIHGRTGRGGGGGVGQTRPVGQYLLQSRANNCYTLTLV